MLGVRDPSLIPAVIRYSGCCDIDLVGHRGGVSNAGIVTGNRKVIPNPQLAQQIANALKANGCKTCTVSVFSCQLSGSPTDCALVDTTPEEEDAKERASFNAFANTTGCKVRAAGCILNMGWRHTLDPDGRGTETQPNWINYPRKIAS